MDDNQYGQEQNQSQNNYYQQNTYEQPPQQVYQSYQEPPRGQQMPDDQLPLTFGQWMIIILVSLIPCVNIIMLLVWAFGTGNLNRKNYSRAMLVWTLIGIVLYIVLIIAFVIVGASSYMY